MHQRRYCRLMAPCGPRKRLSRLWRRSRPSRPWHRWRPSRHIPGVANMLTRGPRLNPARRPCVICPRAHRSRPWRKRHRAASRPRWRWCRPRLPRLQSVVRSGRRRRRRPCRSPSSQCLRQRQPQSHRHPRLQCRRYTRLRPRTQAADPVARRSWYVTGCASARLRLCPLAAAPAMLATAPPPPIYTHTAPTVLLSARIAAADDAQVDGVAYTVLDLIGRGGSSKVFRVLSAKDNQIYALKRYVAGNDLSRMEAGPPVSPCGGGGSSVEALTLMLSASTLRSSPPGSNWPVPTRRRWRRTGRKWIC